MHPRIVQRQHREQEFRAAVGEPKALVQGIVSVVVPAKLIVITPPKAQLHIDELFNAGLPPTIIVGDPGAHGATVLGMHGPGVSTPKAAAVNDAVAGLARLLHRPNGKMFTNGLLSMMLAAGLFSNITGGPVGTTSSVPGVNPNEQAMEAVATTCWPMRRQ